MFFQYFWHFVSSSLNESVIFSARKRIILLPKNFELFICKHFFTSKTHHIKGVQHVLIPPFYTGKINKSCPVSSCSSHSTSVSANFTFPPFHPQLFSSTHPFLRSCLSILRQMSQTKSLPEPTKSQLRGHRKVKTSVSPCDTLCGCVHMRGSVCVCRYW